MTLIERIDAAIESQAEELGVAWTNTLRKNINDALNAVAFRHDTPERQQAHPHVDAILAIMRPVAIEKARNELQMRAVDRLMEDRP